MAIENSATSVFYLDHYFILIVNFYKEDRGKTIESRKNVQQL